MTEPYTPAQRLALILQQYVACYGKGIICIIDFPEIPRENFAVYLDSLRITLKRYDKVPAYLWLHEPTLKQYRLFLFTNAYFTQNLNDILPVITRLWQIQSNILFQIHSWMIVDPGNMNVIENNLMPLAFLQRPENAAWHQRMFGTSHIR